MDCMERYTTCNMHMPLHKDVMWLNNHKILLVVQFIFYSIIRKVYNTRGNELILYMCQ